MRVAIVHFIPSVSACCNCFTSRGRWKSFQVLLSWLTACLCVCVCSAEGMFFCPSVQLVLWLCFPSHFLPAAAWLLLFLADTTQHTLRHTLTYTHTLLVLVPVTVRLSIWLLFGSAICWGLKYQTTERTHARTHTDRHTRTIFCSFLSLTALKRFCTSFIFGLFILYCVKYWRQTRSSCYYYDGCCIVEVYNDE